MLYLHQWVKNGEGIGCDNHPIPSHSWTRGKSNPRPETFETRVFVALTFVYLLPDAAKGQASPSRCHCLIFILTYRDPR